MLFNNTSLLRKVFENPKQLVIWTGAGISFSSGVPIADNLIENIFQELSIYCDKIGPENIKKIYKRFYPDNSRELPRLEFILDKFLSLEQDSKLISENTFSNLMNIFKGGSPSASHIWLVDLLKQGTKNITANFDLLVETCLESEITLSRNIFHYHGAYNNPYECGGVLRKIALGLDNEKESLIINWLQSSDYVLFIGYSGRDYYDIIPLFNRFQQKFQNAIWIEYQRGQELSPSDSEMNYIPKQIKEAFKNFELFTCDCDLYYGEKTRAEKTNWQSLLSTVLHSQPKGVMEILSLEILKSIGLLGIVETEIPNVRSKINDLSNQTKDHLFKLESKVLVGIGKYKSFQRNFSQYKRTSLPLDYRYFESLSASASFSGLRISQAFPTLLRSIKLLLYQKKYFANVIDNESFWWIHEHLHIISRFFKYIPQLIRVRTLFTKTNRHIRFLRINLYRTYRSRCIDELITTDVELLEALQSEIFQTSTEVSNWIETDNLIQVSIVRRKQFENQLLESNKINNPTNIYNNINTCLKEASLMQSIGSYYIAARWLDIGIALCLSLRKQFYVKNEIGLTGKILNNFKLNRLIKKCL